MQRPDNRAAMLLSRENASATARNPIILVTDAWHPQVNGVVHTWSYIQRELAQLGHELHVIHPAGSRGLRVPGEPELLLSTEPTRHLKRLLGSRTPEALHIATEGPLGWAARAMAKAAGWPFTTSYHTRFPEYLKARFGFPSAWTYAMLRRFHRESRAILVPTEAMRDELLRAGFDRTRVWGRGVDSSRFAPGPREAMACGCPVAAYPVTGPIDVVTPGVTGALDQDLRRACLQALELSRSEVRTAAVKRSWTEIARDLLSMLVPIEARAA
jgi:glycosyltransferase involved in cell wall biosynthesis